MLALHALSPVPAAGLADGAVALTPLDMLSVVHAAGADTITFLQGQLTQDVKSLGAHQARLAGYCTAKGRLLASGVVWTDSLAADGGCYLMVSSDLAAAFQKRLSMFVLRAKVKLTAAPLVAIGVTARPGGVATLNAAFGDLPRGAWDRVDLPSGTWIAAPAAVESADGVQARWWWVGTEDALGAAVAALGAAAFRAVPSAWQADDIAAGLPWITAATQDVFVPQTVNLELVGGVSFTKGCYPGQEVVARSHYLGKLKRRMFRGTARAADVHAKGIQPAALPGTDIFHRADPAQPCGRVVNAAMSGPANDPATSHLAVLFESTFVSMESGSVHLGAADGPALTVLPLPYPLADKGA
jgi:folate-binding protein YgfZ